MNEIDMIFLSDARTDVLRKLTEETLASLANSEDASQVRFNVTVVESARSQNHYPNTKTLFPERPFGYHRYMNIGLREGTAPFVCMCNNDLVFHPGWATALLRAFAADTALASASPYCNFFHRERLPNPDRTAIPGYQNGVHVAGWCIFARRSIFQTIGPLDERFEFWYCDDDYRLTLEKHGLQHALITDSHVDHLGSRTLDAELSDKRKNRMTRRQALFFQYKWGHRSLLLYWLKTLKFHLKHFSEKN